ncbi:MAG: hypothetical protein ABEH83_01225 [Halobacterium sp.]
MPGRSGRFTGIALLAAAIAAIGYVALGWRFGDGTSNPIAFAIALVAVAFAVVATVRDRA